jgi:hypothetical protein
LTELVGASYPLGNDAFEPFLFYNGGFTEGKGSRRMSFGALLLGAYRNRKLHYFGDSGSGFSERGLQQQNTGSS